MKKSNLIVNIVGLALVAFVIIMLFVPYFSYPPEVKARDPKVTGIVSGELLDTVTAVKDNLPKESCSIAFYAWRPKEAGQVIDYVAKQYPDLTVSNGSFAIPVAAIMLCGLAAMIFGVIKINKKTPSILFLLFGLICTWAFLYMSPLWLGSFATLLFIVSLVITAGGLVYTVSFLKEKSGSEVFNLVGNLLCAALLIALIFVMFPNTHEGTFLTFTTIDSAADAGASWNFFGSPLLLLIVSVIVLAFSLFKCNRAWPLYAQLVAGLLGMITVLSNPVFSNNVSAMGAGLAASMLLTAISIVRLAIAIIALVNGKAAPAVEEDEETEKAGRKLHIIINLASAALLIALIIVLFTVSAGENFLTFNLRDLGTTPQTNPYLVTPGNKGDFGTQVLASPVLLLIVSVIVLAVSLFKYDREWPMFLQLFTGAAGLYTILSNRAFETNGAGMAIGIIICAILAAAALARIVMFAIRRGDEKVATCNYLACIALLLAGVFLFTSSWTIGKPTSGSSAFVSVAEVGISVILTNGKDDDDPAKKAATLSSKLTKELQNEMKVEGTYTEDEIKEVKVEARDYAWIFYVMLVLALAGIALNIIFREKFFTGIINLAIGAAGALIYMVTHSFHYSTNYLYEMLFFSVTIVMGVIILVEILLGKKKEEEAEPVKSNW